MTAESPRLEEFQQQVDELRLSGGRANPERTLVRISVTLFVISLIIEIFAFSESRGTTNSYEQTDMVILALLGVVVALGGVALFVRASLTRYFRYWLVRLVYEDRANTDRIVDAIEASRD